MTGTQLFLQGDVPVQTSFQPDNGGLGLAFLATTIATVAVPLPLGHGRQYLVSNDGWVSYWYGFGGADFLATVAYMEVLPGVQLAQTFPNDARLTHVSVITRTGATTGTMNFGRGD